MHFELRIGPFLLTRHGLYRLRWHRAARNKQYRWRQWDRIWEF